MPQISAKSSLAKFALAGDEIRREYGIKLRDFVDGLKSSGQKIEYFRRRRKAICYASRRCGDGPRKTS